MMEIEGLDEAVDRWKTPFNFIEDVFRVRDPLTGVLVPYTPYPYIVDFIDDGFKNLNMDRLVIKSRQIGFSTAMELEAIMTCLTFPDVEVSVISNRYPSSKKIVRACGRMIKDAVIPLPINERDIQKESITFLNGSTIIPYSSNPDSIRSENIIKAYLDEFAFFPEQENLIAAVEPKTSRGGSITYTSTVLSSSDEFMRMFNEAQRGNIPGMKTYFHPLYEPGTVDQFMSLHKQPHLVPICSDIRIDRAEQTRLKSPDRFMQEYMCVPIDDTKAYYPRALILSCLDDNATVAMRQRARSKQRTGIVYMGIDLALVKDETAIIVIYIEGGEYYVVHQQTTQAKYHEQLRIIDNLVRNYRPTRIRSDKTGTIGIQAERDLKDKYGYIVDGVTYSNVIKQEMAMRLKMMMQNREHGNNPSIILPNNEELITQLHGIKIDVTANSNVVFSGKDGGGLDDLANALWLAIPPEVTQMCASSSVTRADHAPKMREMKRDTSTSYSTVSRSSGARKLRKHIKRGT